jgi:hypothetical protein
MKRMIALASLAALIAGTTTFLGCSKQADDQQPAAESPASVAKMSAAELDPDVKEAIAGLSEEDQKLVLAQKVCPVTKEPLGSMGEPIKITVEGRHLFVCCAGCEEQARENFDAYYAKLSAPDEPAAN